MKRRTRPNFTPEFRLECAQLVVDKGYSVIEASQAMNVGKSSLDKWVRQLKGERNSITSKATPLTPDQLEIRELKKRIAGIQEEKEIKKISYGSFDVGLAKQFTIIKALKGSNIRNTSQQL
jgi:transposase